MKKEEKVILSRLVQTTPAFSLNNERIEFISPDKNICGIYSPSEIEDFEDNTPINDVGEFLSILDTLGDETIIDSTSKVMELKNGNSSVKYVKSNSDWIKTIPESFFTRVAEMEVNADFIVTIEDIKKVLKLSGVLGLKDLKISSENSELSVKALDSNNEENSVRIDIDSDTNSDFEIYISIENLAKLGQDTYNVQVLEDVVKFTSETVSDLTYYVVALNV